MNQQTLHGLLCGFLNTRSCVSILNPSDAGDVVLGLVMVYSSFYFISLANSSEFYWALWLPSIVLATYYCMTTDTSFDVKTWVVFNTVGAQIPATLFALAFAQPNSSEINS